MGADPKVDNFTAVARNGERVPMSNIVSIVRGESNEAIVVLAHRDNVPPGADEANSALGTAVVVELAAAFADQRNARTLVSRPSTAVAPATPVRDGWRRACRAA